MKLTFQISSSPDGERWMARFPSVEVPPAEVPQTTAGKIDEGFIRRFFAEMEREGFAVTSAKDDGGVYVLAYEFLHQLGNVVSNLEASGNHDCATTAETREDKMLTRKMKRGNISYVRLTIDRFRGILRVRVSAANPKEVVGNALRSARAFAVDCARIMRHIAAELEKHNDGRPAALVQDLSADSGIVEEAKLKDEMQIADDARAQLAERRATCPNHVHSPNGEFCTPSIFNCPLFRNGRCNDVVTGGWSHATGEIQKRGSPKPVRTA